jgi:hypothetical protein
MLTLTLRLRVFAVHFFELPRIQEKLQRPKLSRVKAGWMKELESSKITVTLFNNVGIPIVP